MIFNGILMVMCICLKIIVERKKRMVLTIALRQMSLMILKNSQTSLIVSSPKHSQMLTNQFVKIAKIKFVNPHQNNSHMFTFITNSAHYTEVLSRVKSVKHTLWIGTADIKDIYVERETRPKKCVDMVKSRPKKCDDVVESRPKKCIFAL